MFLDALQRSDRDVPFRMWNSDAARFLGMLELNMAALGGNFVPAILLQGRNDITAFHLQNDTHECVFLQVPHRNDRDIALDRKWARRFSVGQQQAADAS